MRFFVKQLGILLCSSYFLFGALSLQAQKTLVKSVYFGGGSYYVDPGQTAEIDQFLQSIPNIQYYQIAVSSHTDNIGGKAYNQWLSQMRSRSTIREILRNGIEPEQIFIQNNGQENPLYDNASNQGRMANRRVDIILTPLYL